LTLFSFTGNKPFNMRKIRLILALIVLTGSLNRLSAQDYTLGLGLRLSTAAPTINNSVSVKYFLNDRAALEGLVSFGSRFGIGGLYEVHQLIGAIPSLNWFYGGGAYVGFENSKVYTGPTGIIGIDYKFQNAPVNLSLDWKPELDISPTINFVPDAFALSARFTLK
jgi:hypothetical protein